MLYIEVHTWSFTCCSVFVSVTIYFSLIDGVMLKCFWLVAKAMAAKHKKPILSKRILIPQSDQEDSTQDSVTEFITNVRLTFLCHDCIFAHSNKKCKVLPKP